MPYRRHRRRRTRRKPVALRAVRRLARFVDTELHEIETNNNFVNVTQTGVQVLLTPIATGDDRIDRNGDQVTLRRADVRWTILVGATDSILRVILFMDRQANGAVPTLADVLSVPTFPLVSMINVDNKKRFKIIMDRCYRTNVNGDHVTACYRKTFKLSNKMRFDGASATIVDIVSGPVYCLALSDQAGGANSPDFTLGSQIWFAP